MLTIEQNVLLIYQYLFIKHNKKNNTKNKDITGIKDQNYQTN